MNDKQCIKTTDDGTRCTRIATIDRYCEECTRAYDALVHDHQVLGWHLAKYQGQALTVKEIADAMGWSQGRTRAAIDFELEKHGKLDSGWEAVGIEVHSPATTRMVQREAAH